MKETVAYLETLFVTENDSYTPSERAEHNAHIQKSIDAITALDNFIDCVNMIVSSGEVSDGRLQVYRSIQSSDLFKGAEATLITMGSSIK